MGQVRDALEQDALQNLLEMAYQKQQAGLRAGVHTHRCHGCEKEVVCVCGDRRQVDRMTGKKRKFWCIGCGEVKAAFELIERQDDMEQFT